MAQKDVGKDCAIEYHFLRSLISESEKSVKVPKPFLETNISSLVCRRLFSALRNRLGIVESLKEYSTYKYRNLELTVLPDGSSFCHQVRCKPLEDEGLPISDLKRPKVLVMMNERVKISNDIFPPEYTYDDVFDNVDIVFPWGDGISVVMSARFSSDNMSTDARTVRGMGRPEKTGESDKLWCEVYVKVGCECSVEDVHECVKFVEKAMKTKATRSKTT